MTPIPNEGLRANPYWRYARQLEFADPVASLIDMLKSWVKSRTPWLMTQRSPSSMLPGRLMSK